MLTFTKTPQFRIIAITVAMTLFFESTVYGTDLCDVRHLRVPLTSGDGRIGEAGEIFSGDKELAYFGVFRQWVARYETHAAFGAVYGMSQSEVTRCVNGLRKPPPKLWLKMALETGLTALELVGEDIPIYGLAFLEYLGDKTQVQFAKEEDIDKDSVYKWVHGIRMLPKRYWLRVVEVTGISVEEICGRDISLYVLAFCELIGRRKISEVAGEEGVNISTVRRWMNGENMFPEKFLSMKLPRTKKTVEEYLELEVSESAIASAKGFDRLNNIIFSTISLITSLIIAIPIFHFLANLHIDRANSARPPLVLPPEQPVGFREWDLVGKIDKILHNPLALSILCGFGFVMLGVIALKRKARRERAVRLLYEKQRMMRADISSALAESRRRKIEAVPGIEDEEEGYEFGSRLVAVHDLPDFYIAMALEEEGQSKGALDICCEILRGNPLHIGALLLMLKIVTSNEINLEKSTVVADCVREFYRNANETQRLHLLSYEEYPKWFNGLEKSIKKELSFLSATGERIYSEEDLEIMAKNLAKSIEKGQVNREKIERTMEILTKYGKRKLIKDIMRPLSPSRLKADNPIQEDASAIIEMGREILKGISTRIQAEQTIGTGI